VTGARKPGPARALPLFVLLCLALGLYFNTVFNGYCLDDGLVILENDSVQNGLRGIPAIITSDSYAGFYHKMGAEQELSAGRYRPLSLVTFALEHQIAGNNPLLSHVVNLVLYLLTIFLLFRLLGRDLFPEDPRLAWLTTFFFAIHPLHTEVVANIKSRDEILSLLFLLLAFHFALRRIRTRGRRSLVAALACYFLALLSKEYGLSFLLLFPLWL
jgi:protein O-mannosyl-transferase